MDIALAILISAAWILGPMAIAIPKLRSLASLVLLAAAVTALASALLAPGERSLDIVHTFAGFQGHDLEPSAVDFVVDHRQAPALHWAAIFAIYALPWALGLFVLRRRPAPANAFLLPMLAAWSGIGAWLLMQIAAAPAAVVQPFGLERILFPAGLSLCILVAQQSPAMLPMLARLSVGVVAMRLPAALISKLCSDGGYGTSLDTHTIVEFLNPLTQQPLSTTAGSGEQQFWLIWCEHVLVFPALFLLSYTGVGIGVYLFTRHGQKRGH